MDNNKYYLNSQYSFQITVNAVEIQAPITPPPPPLVTVPQPDPLSPPSDATIPEPTSDSSTTANLSEDSLSQAEDPVNENQTPTNASTSGTTESTNSGGQNDQQESGGSKVNSFGGVLINGGAKQPSKTVQKAIMKLQTDLTARLTSISNKGEVTVRFSEDLIVVKNFQALIGKALSLKLTTQNDVKLLSWNATTQYSSNDTTYDRFTIQLNFSDPMLISQSSQLDKLEVTIVGNALFKRVSDKRPIKYKYQMSQSVPMQLVESSAIQNLVAVGGVASNMMSFMGYGLLITQIFMSVSMSLLWGLMNTMQMFVHLKMLNILMPINAQLVISYMENLANFKIIKKFTDQAVNLVFMMVPDSQDNSDDSLDSNDEQPGDILKNIKLILFGVLVFVFLVLNTIALYLLSKRLLIIRQGYEMLKSKLFFNGILRSLLETYLKLSIATFNAFPLVDFTGEQNKIIGSTVTIILLIGIVLGYPLFCYYFLKSNKRKLGQKEFIQKYSSLFLNLDLKKEWSFLMPALFLIRRSMYAFSIAFLGNAYLLQIFIQISSSLLMLSFLYKVKPYDDPLLNRIEMFNEVCLLVSAYFLLCFTDFVGAPDTRYTIGWAFSGFLGFNLLTNWLVLFYRMLQPLVIRIQRLLDRKRVAKKELHPKPIINDLTVKDESAMIDKDITVVKQEIEYGYQKTREYIESIQQRLDQMKTEQY